MLLISQRNQLFQILIEKGVQPSDFEEYTSDTYYRIRLRESPNGIYFIVERQKKDSEDAYRITKRPGSSASPDNKDISFYKIWDSPSAYCSTDEFKSWAEAVKLEVDSPDLWKENAIAVQLFASDYDLTTERFSVSELGALQGQLRVLIQNFEASDLPNDAKEKLILIVRTASLKAENFNKKDWWNWTVGAFATAIASLGLSSTQKEEFSTLTRLASGGLFLQE